MTVTVDIRYRPYQLAAHRARTRFTVRVFHRRAGKSFLSATETLADALQTARKDFRAYYIAPSYKQAKGIAFDYLKSFVQMLPGAEVNESELRVDLPNGSRIQLLGAENYDTLRGRYADKVDLDETAMIPSSAWTSVIAPMLADRKGSATFIGTPNGRMNLLHDLWQYAGETDDPDWSRLMLKHGDTNALDPKELASLHRLMSEEEFEQEMNCSFDAALRGSYYAKPMAAADDAGRITTVAHDRLAGPVQASLDLGWSDLMIACFWQQQGTEHRLLRAEGYQATSIPDMVSQWRATLPFPCEHVVLPHDAKVHELGTGKTREQVFRALGFTTAIAPNQGLHEGIEQVRNLLPHVWFDRDNTKVLREALLSYRSEFDEVRGVHRTTPIHDWASHWADAVRTYATGARPVGRANMAGPQPAPAWSLY